VKSSNFNPLSIDPKSEEQKESAEQYRELVKQREQGVTKKTEPYQ